MSIIDDARGEAEECPYAPAVLRVAALADELDESGGMLLTEHLSPEDAVGRGIQMCAARIRAVLEGDEV